MTFHEKLDRLLQNMNRRAVARAAGLPIGTLQNLTIRRSVPGIAVALKVAQALGVDPGWLIDDGKGWPPMRVESEESASAS